MAREVYPSSYICDCGYRADFFERTIREMKEMSRKKHGRHTLGCDDDKHAVAFSGGEMVDMVCPHRQTRAAAKPSGFPVFEVGPDSPPVTSDDVKRLEDE